MRAHILSHSHLFELSPWFANSIAFEMPVVSVVVRPYGLHPVMQVKAHHLVREEGMSYDDACDEVHNMQGKPPCKKSLWSSVQRAD